MLRTNPFGGMAVHASVIAVVAILVAACSGAPSAASPSTGHEGVSASPPSAWTSLKAGAPLLGGDVFGGAGNQFVEAAVAYRGGFVAAGEDLPNDSKPANGTIWRSDDGTTWIREDDPTRVFAGSGLTDLVTNGDRILAFGATETGETLEWISDDGSSWRAIGRAQAPKPQLGGVVAGNGSFLALASDGGVPPSTILRSADGERWTETTFAAAFPAVVVSDVTPYRGGWVALGSKRPDPSAQSACCGPTPPGLAWFSADGVSWSAAHIDAPHSVGRAFPGAAGLLAVGSGPMGCGGCVEGPNLWHSADGLTWDLLGQQPMANIVYESDGSRLVRATSDQHTIDLSWSADGVTWRSLASSLPYHDEYGPFVVGPNGLLFLENPASASDVGADGGVWYLSAE